MGERDIAPASRAGRQSTARAPRAAGLRHRRRLPALLACLPAVWAAWLAPHAARAETSATPAGGIAALAGRDRLLDDPGGARTRLERLGIDLQGFAQQVAGAEPSGGGASSETGFGHSASFDLFGRVDLDALAGWRGGRLLLHVQGQYDRSTNDQVGALSDPVDDADFDGPVYVSQLWLGQDLLSGRLHVQLGYLLQATLIDRNAYANSEDRQFLATFLDNDGVVPLPVGLAAAAIVTPVPWLELAVTAADADNAPRMAGFDTAFDGADSLSWFVEASARSPFASRDRPGRYRVGVAVDGRERVDFASGRRSRGHVVTWLSADQQLWRAERGDRRLGAFARLGHADPDASPVEWFWSLGLELAGPLPSRERDVLGLAVHQSIGSAEYRSHVDERFDRETGLELYYALRALGWLVLTPDLQVIVDPGATGAGGTAVVASLRTRVVF